MFQDNKILRTSLFLIVTLLLFIAFPGMVEAIGVPAVQQTTNTNTASTSNGLTPGQSCITNATVPSGCNPACGKGEVCIDGNKLSACISQFQNSLFTGLQGIFGDNYYCTPIPTPAQCQTNFECTPYTCGTNHYCTITPAPTPTSWPTQSPLCPSDVCATALGAISTQPVLFIVDILKIILSFVGGIAVLLIIFNGYRIMASSGNAEKLQEARDGLTSAIVGLLFIVFSVAILQLITVNLLHIPGFQ